MTGGDPPDVVAAKRALRQRMRLARADHRPDAALIAAILADTAFHPDEIVAGTWPLPGEADLRPLWQRLHERGHRIALPETPPPGAALRFRAWAPGCAMVPGRFGTSYPQAGEPVVPGLLFVPLLAFDRQGYRLGFGGGYYDRTLAALPLARAIGYGFAFQQVELVPRGPHDLPLSAIVTEQGRIGPKRCPERRPER